MSVEGQGRDERRRSSVEGSYGRRRVVGREGTNG